MPHVNVYLPTAESCQNVINDLPNATELFTLLFADDTTFQVSGFDIKNLFETANSELAKASNWFKANKLTLNVKKTKLMVFSGQNKNIDLQDLKIKITRRTTGVKSFYFVIIKLLLKTK